MNEFMAQLDRAGKTAKAGETSFWNGYLRREKMPDGSEWSLLRFKGPKELTPLFRQSVYYLVHDKKYQKTAGDHEFELQEILPGVGTTVFYDPGKVAKVVGTFKVAAGKGTDGQAFLVGKVAGNDGRVFSARVRTKTDREKAESLRRINERKGPGEEQATVDQVEVATIYITVEDGKLAAGEIAEEPSSPFGGMVKAAPGTPDAPPAPPASVEVPEGAY